MFCYGVGTELSKAPGLGAIFRIFKSITGLQLALKKCRRCMSLRHGHVAIMNLKFLRI